MTTLDAHSVCEEGYTVVSRLGDWELTVDAAGEDGPTANHVLIADYASCYVPAFRVGAEQRGVDDLGRVEVDVEGDLDDDEDLEAIRFHIQTEAEVDDETMAEIVERGEDICHVHSAIRDGLQADITVETGAF